MKFRNKIVIDFTEFLKSGKFDYIKPGQTKEWILNNFPDPDLYCRGSHSDFMNPRNRIWTYGFIEFHFNSSNELVFIFSDNLNAPGSDDLMIVNRIYTGQDTTLIRIQSGLNAQKIDYFKSGNAYGVNLILKSGVELGFIDDDPPVPTENDLFLNSFSFGIR